MKTRTEYPPRDIIVVYSHGRLLDAAGLLPCGGTAKPETFRQKLLFFL